MIRENLIKLGVYAIFVQGNFPTDFTYGVGSYKIDEGARSAELDIGLFV